MQPDDRARLQHIMQACDEAIELLHQKEPEDLVEEAPLAYSVLWLLTLIGEAANQVNQETRASLPLPWSEMVGMRDRLVHGYFDLNLGIVHQTVVGSP